MRLYKIAILLLALVAPAVSWAQGSGAPTTPVDPRGGAGWIRVMDVSAATTNQTSGPIFAPPNAVGVKIVVDVTQCDSLCTMDLALDAAAQAVCDGGDRDNLVCYRQSDCWDSDTESGTDGTCQFDAITRMFNNLGGSQGINATGAWMIGIDYHNSSDISGGTGVVFSEGMVPPVFEILVDQDAGTASYTIDLYWLY